MTQVKNVTARFEVTDGFWTGCQSVPVKRVITSDDGSMIEVVLDYWPPVQKTVDDLLKGLKPEVLVRTYQDDDDPYIDLGVISVCDGENLQSLDPIPLYTLDQIRKILTNNL